MFDLRRDMAVGLDEPVRKVVAKAAGLRDLRDAVGDEPALVAVPQPVKREPGPDRLRLFRVSPSTAGRNTRRSKSLRRKGWP